MATPFVQKQTMAHHKPGPDGKPIGRPSEYKPEYCDMVIEHMAKGRSLTAFAGSIRVGWDTVYNWVARHSDFAQAVSRARSARVDWLEAKLLSSRKGAETTAAIFALRNAAPHEWKDVKYQEHQHTHEIHMLTDAQLNAIAAGAAEIQPLTIEHEPEGQSPASHTLPSTALDLLIEKETSE